MEERKKERKRERERECVKERERDGIMCLAVSIWVSVSAVTELGILSWEGRTIYYVKINSNKK